MNWTSISTVAFVCILILSLATCYTTIYLPALYRHVHIPHNQPTERYNILAFDAIVLDPASYRVLLLHEISVDFPRVYAGKFGIFLILCF